MHPTLWKPTSAAATPNMFRYQSDGGLVGPLLAPGIHVFQQCTPETKAKIISLISQEWSELDISEAFINEKWPGGSDIFYVMMNESDSQLIGCVAVDRHNFYPFITNLFVVPEHRKKGHAKTLIQHGIAFTKSMGFDTARLWCRPHLLSWYTSMGWTQESTQGEITLLVHSTRA